MTTHDLINECAELFRAHDLTGSEKVVLNAKTCIANVPMVPALHEQAWAVPEEAREKLLPCPFCGEDIRHVESWAKSFDPPRLYHEWHHPKNLCLLSGESINTWDDADIRAKLSDQWNQRGGEPRHTEHATAQATVQAEGSVGLDAEPSGPAAAAPDGHMKAAGRDAPTRKDGDRGVESPRVESVPVANPAPAAPSPADPSVQDQITTEMGRVFNHLVTNSKPMDAAMQKAARQVSEEYHPARGGLPEEPDGQWFLPQFTSPDVVRYAHALRSHAEELQREISTARSSALEEAAKVCEQGATGVAVEIGTQTFPLGIMFKHGGDAQKATATALAAAIRALPRERKA